MGVGATPLTEGYAYLVSRDLEEHVPGTFLINLGIPGARIDALTEQSPGGKHSAVKPTSLPCGSEPMTLSTGWALHDFKAISDSSFDAFRLRYLRLW